VIAAVDMPTSILYSSQKVLADQTILGILFAAHSLKENDMKCDAKKTAELSGKEIRLAIRIQHHTFLEEREWIRR